MKTMKDALVELGFEPKNANKLVKNFAAQITDRELMASFPIIRNNFAQLKEAHPEIAAGLLVAVVTNDFYARAGETDTVNLKAASQRTFSGSESSAKKIQQFKKDPTWDSFQKLFGNEMVSQPEADEIFRRRNDLKPQEWTFSTYVTTRAYMVALKHQPSEK